MACFFRNFCDYMDLNAALRVANAGTAGPDMKSAYFAGCGYPKK
jgi:hypothetical protein